MELHGHLMPAVSCGSFFITYAVLRSRTAGRCPEMGGYARMSFGQAAYAAENSQIPFGQFAKDSKHCLCSLTGTISPSFFQVEA